jgi:hypothetical protein
MRQRLYLRPASGTEVLVERHKSFGERAAVVVSLDCFWTSAPRHPQHIFVCVGVKVTSDANDLTLSLKDADHTNPPEGTWAFQNVECEAFMATVWPQPELDQ